MKKSLIIVGILIVIVIFSLISLNHSRQVVKENNLKVGAILSLSGELAFLGEEIMRGSELALEGKDIEVVYEDDQSLVPSAAVNSAKKLLEVDKVDVAFTGIIEVAKPIAPIFDNKQIPLLVTWDTNEFLRNAGPYIFSTGFSTEKNGYKMADFAYDDLGLRKVAIIAHIDPWAEIISEAFKDQFEVRGGKVVFIKKQFLTEKDYRASILKAKQTEVEGVYFPMLPPTSVNFLEQVKELGLDTVLMSGDAFILDVIIAAGSAAENVYYTNIFTPKEDELIVLYKDKYGKDPIDIALVSFGYDGINTILAAHEANPTNIKEGLNTVIGPSREIERVEKIYKVTNGAPIEVK